MELLAGDIGGTKARLALYNRSYNRGEYGFQKVFQRQYKSAEASSLASIIKSFLDESKAKPVAACFGIPGPVINGRVKVTNLPWEIEESVLSSEVGIPRVKLVNDLVSYTSAIPYLGAAELEQIHPGATETSGQVALVVAPGTGLGTGFLTAVNGRFTAFASEGGHASFAPTSDEEIRLLAFLRQTFPLSVSWERILCGPGLMAIYRFLSEDQKALASPQIIARMETEGSAAPISEAALSKSDPLCVHAVNLFLELLGSHAANLVLTFLATRGVYLGGGIPPKLLPLIREGAFMKGFLRKQRLVNVIESTPVHVIKDDQVALLGAAVVASYQIQAA